VAQFGTQWKKIAQTYHNELIRVCNGNIQRLRDRYRTLSRHGTLPTIEEITLAIAEGIEESALWTWLARRRSVRGLGQRGTSTRARARLAYLASLAVVGLRVHVVQGDDAPFQPTGPLAVELMAKKPMQQQYRSSNAQSIVRCMFATCPNVYVRPRTVGCYPAAIVDMPPRTQLATATFAAGRSLPSRRS